MAAKQSLAAAIKMLLVGFAWICVLFWLAALLRLYVSNSFGEEFMPKIKYIFGDAQTDLIKYYYLGTVTSHLPDLLCARMRNIYRALRVNSVFHPEHEWAMAPTCTLVMTAHVQQ